MTGTIIFIQVAIILMSITIHEYAHGWTANKLGDSTAKDLGRLSLNPIKHIDPVGSILVPCFIAFVLSLPPFGWAKPVPVNFARLRQPRRDMALVAIAGPAINIICALCFSVVVAWLSEGLIKAVLVYIILLNLLLAFFNLTPIPPLDGSRIVMSLLPRQAVAILGKLEPFGILIVFGLLSLGYLDWIFDAVYITMNVLGISLS